MLQEPSTIKPESCCLLVFLSPLKLHYVWHLRLCAKILNSQSESYPLVNMLWSKSKYDLQGSCIYCIIMTTYVECTKSIKRKKILNKEWGDVKNNIVESEILCRLVFYIHQSTVWLCLILDSLYGLSFILGMMLSCFQFLIILYSSFLIDR